MKKYIHTSFLLLLAAADLLMVSCGGGQPKQGAATDSLTKPNAYPPPNFTISLKAIKSPTSFPYLQSFAWARQGSKVLLIGGRIEGFHGINQDDSIFKTSKANTSIWVIDLNDYSYSQLALDMHNPASFQFASTNMEFFQSGDTLYLAGGFGIKNEGDKKSNYTFPGMLAISVSNMITQVQSKGNPFQALLYGATSPFVQVTGGELVVDNGWCYLLFGQNYTGEYTPGLTGAYTSAVRKFKFANGRVTDTSSWVDANMHRRDLPVAKIIQQSGNFYAGLGGVFNSNDDGYQNPVYIRLGDIQNISTDTLMQKTNQYLCANASIYDPQSDANFTVLLGGIGRYQYVNGAWEDGDAGAKLPFVKTITQMVYQNNIMQQWIQLPPTAPEMPGWLGANAVFFPDQSLLLDGETLDYSKLTANETKIGIMYGGIKSTQATSNGMYPTSLNKTIYEVWLKKSEGMEK